MELNIKNNIQKITLVGIFAAIIGVFSTISIPTPSQVPITLQTFIIAFSGYLLGRKLSVLAVAVYILIGAIGFPVFSGFKSGVGTLFGITGGFIWGFLALAFFSQNINTSNKNIKSIFFGIIGLIICHFCGVIQYSFISGNSFVNSILAVSLPYMIKDLISILIAYVCAKNSLKILSKTKIYSNN